MTLRGTLFLVVGPSGAGKDTLISEASSKCPDIIVMTRSVTRPTTDDANREISIDEFSELKRANYFALSWDAHGLHYGITRELEEMLASGQSVIVNGSRSIVEEAREKFSPLRIIHVTAPLDILSRRLRQRGREDEFDIDRRIGRSSRGTPKGPDVVTIDNSKSVEEGLAAFIEAIT